MAQEKKQLTLRLPIPVYEYIMAKAKNENKAINEVITDITEEHMKWHEGEQILRDIAVVREQARNQYGVHPDSVDEISKMREGDR